MRASKSAAFLEEIEARLKKRYLEQMKTTLEHSSPWELLVATVLSAQAQDASVNEVTPRLFRRFDSIKKFASARPSDLYPCVRSIGLYRGKSKNIVNSAKAIMSRFRGNVPMSMEELVTLPGVGRKTANVVLSNAFGINSGIAIDTHCITVSNRLGLVHTKDPKRIEAKLMSILPQKEYGNISHLFIALGRDACTARKKHCDRCVLKDICPSSTSR